MEVCFVGGCVEVFDFVEVLAGKKWTAFDCRFNVIPNLDTSRRLLSNIITAIVILAPYLLSVSDMITSELMCYVER